MPPLLDLDESLLKVRSRAARAHIGDAIAAFRVGALRAAVVSTWTAVVFDIMEKIREIELTGDPRARQQVERFEAIRSANDISGSLEMERSILEMAQNDFELLTHHEYSELTRLREDRNRCAHPAMNTAEEAYQPSAELVRYHLASALTHLLVREPVQGKAALARLEAEVESPLFPTDIAAAVQVLRGGPLQRPKEVLVRNFFVVLAKGILRGPRATEKKYVHRALAAIAAAVQMHPAVMYQVYSTEVPRILSGLNDLELLRVLRMGVALPAIWDHMPDSVRTKLERAIAVLKITIGPGMFLDAARTPSLRAEVEARVAALDRDDLLALFREDAAVASALRPLVARAIEMLISSNSFEETNSLISTILLRCLAVLTESDFERIARAANENSQVRGGNSTLPLLVAIRDSGVIRPERFFEIFYDSDLGSVFSFLLEDADPAHLAAPRGNALALSVGDRVRHPTFGDGAVDEVEGSGLDAQLLIRFDRAGVGRRYVIRANTRLDLIT
jgi:hypothetical protein